VDALDVVLVVLVVAAAVHGLRLGALVQVLTFGGFWVGLTLGALFSILAVSDVHSSPAKVAIVLSLVLGFAVMFGIIGRVLGSWSTAVVRRHHLGGLDSGLGVAVAVVAVLFSAWLVANVVGANTRYGWVSTQVERSDILRAIDDVMPPVPTVFSRVQAFLNSSGFPPVFAGLTPPTASPVAAPTTAQAQAVGLPVAASTIKIVGDACGYLQEGSGFSVGPGLVVTNAHVVAGEPITAVEVGGVAYPATPVSFDPSYDLAVLRTRAPLGRPLTLDPSDVSRGTQGAIVGYPQDGPLAIGPAGVAADLVAQGRDIYNEGVVIRDVYEIDAEVQPGNSGGPLVADNGMVVGVVFSRSTVDPGVGYALTSPGVLRRVQQASLRTTPVNTGGCTQG
jgi:S1-C subfamily serine protease